MPTETWRTVTTVTSEENLADRVFTLGLAEDPQGQGGHLILQTSLDEPTAQDQGTGMDSYCAMDDTGGVQYGGIEHVELRGPLLSIRFSEDAADELAVPDGTLALELQVSDDDLERLRTGLRRVLTYGNPGQQPTLVGI